ncbi:OmpA/MotB family protein [Thiomicrorhabdus xiamenensis]|uniref:OmpA family protein n=1 Tax=Thiomicrorhabdus xiamenensis TaxID=2739063 RepID=A0A7D4SRM3_9GAMM|nr:flagellar motor protein MotB [Thiomicrorhabdus xiamenensis]QKI88563.1 OmpA family protein [Thiomicrorhabdus xiamenensis]
MDQEEPQNYTPPAKPKKCSSEESDDWMVTYADAMTLVMGFFVLILSMSMINQSKFEEVSAAINEGLLKKEKKQTISPLNELNKNLSQTLLEHQVLPQEAIEQGDNYLKIDLPGNILFATGSAELGGGSSRLIADIANDINAFSLPEFNIEIEGHTDDIPISTVRFPSNWELSSSRAISVLQVFLAQGVDGNRLKAIGYAETRPKVPNKDAQGNAIKQNQKLNRRVEIKIARNI